jgi:hypothetical protein
MDDMTAAFIEFADDFISSAEAKEHLALFPMIAAAAWNIADQTEESRDRNIQLFIEKFRCPTFVWNGATRRTKDKILELCDRKLRLFPDILQKIAGLDIEGTDDGLIYTVVSKTAQQEDQRER